MRADKEVVKQTRYLYGWSRSNVIDPASKDPQFIIHLITPCANAKLSTLCQKFQAIFGDIFFPSKSKQDRISPLLQLLIYREMAYDYFSPDFKKTVYINQIVKELTRTYKQGKAFELISKFIQSIHDQYFDKGRFKQLREGKHRVERLQKWEEFVKIRASQCLNDLKKIVLSQNQDKVFWTDDLLKAQVDTVLSIEVLPSDRQHQKWKIFQEMHKRSYQCSLLEPNSKSSSNFELKMSRPSINSEPVVMRLEHLVQLQAEGHKFGVEYQMLLKDIMEQLKKYHMDTSNFNQGKNSYYDCLSPQYVLFDQIALRPKLSYQPLLLRLLGLTKRPASLESTITWFCTPRQFDYFQGQEELNPAIRRCLADPYYGNFELYKRQGPIDRSIIQKQRQELDAASSSICVDRFLLIGHYLLKGKVFGELKPELATSYSLIQRHFKRKLTQAKEEARRDAQKLEVWLGPLSSDMKGGFGFSFFELAEALAMNEDDSVLVAQRFTRFVKYLNLRYQTIREIVQILSNISHTFGKINNAKKCMIILYVVLLQCLQELRLLTLETRIEDIPEMRNFIQKNGRKLIGDKPAENSIQNLKKRIEEYHVRAAKQQTYKFLLDDEGINLLKNLEELHNSFQVEKKRINDICEKFKNPPKENHRQEIRVKLAEGRTQLRKAYKTYSEQVSKFVQVELRTKYGSGPHHLAQNATEEVKDYYSQVTHRFELLIHTFLTATPENFLTYDSLLMPLLHPEEPKYYPSPSQINPSFLKGEKEGLRLADKLANFKPLTMQPRQRQ